MNAMVAHGRALISRVQRDDVPGVAAELAYRFLFAMFPFLLLIAAVSGYITGWFNVENPAQRIMEDIGSTLPDDARSLIEGQLSTIFAGANPGLLSFGAIGALWAASGGVKSIMKALNRAYDVEEARGFIRKQAVGLGLTLLASVAFIMTALIIIGGQIAGEAVAEQIGIEGVWSTVVSLARIPVVLALLIGAVMFVYWAAPNYTPSWRGVVPGAVLFAFGWIIATLGFAFYVANFGSYQSTYGAIGAVIVLMLWLYISSFVFLLGAEVNAHLEGTGPESEEVEEETSDDSSSKDHRSPARAA